MSSPQTRTFLTSYSNMDYTSQRAPHSGNELAETQPTPPSHSSKLSPKGISKKQQTVTQLKFRPTRRRAHRHGITFNTGRDFTGTRPAPSKVSPAPSKAPPNAPTAPKLMKEQVAKEEARARAMAQRQKNKADTIAVREKAKVLRERERAGLYEWISWDSEEILERTHPISHQVGSTLFFEVSSHVLKGFPLLLVTPDRNPSPIISHLCSDSSPRQMGPRATLRHIPRMSRISYDCSRRKRPDSIFERETRLLHAPQPRSIVSSHKLTNNARSECYGNR